MNSQIIEGLESDFKTASEKNVVLHLADVRRYAEATVRYVRILIQTPRERWHEENFTF